MRIGVISDLHIDGNEEMLPSNTSFVELLSNKLKKENVDYLLLAGDISNDYKANLNFLNELEQRSNRKVLFTPGNHDYWSKNNNIANTWNIYNKYKNWKGCVSENPFQLNEDWIVIGNSGWYDYSFGNQNFTEEQFNEMYYMDRTWQDSLYIDWGRTNKEMHRFFYEKIENELQKYKDKKIILMTHMVTHPDFIVANPNQQWTYFNAFLGSIDYQNLYREYNVQYGIMGHVHHRSLSYTNNTEMICACLGNYPEWRTKDPVKEIDDAFYSFNI